MITYKAAMVSIKVNVVRESYTSGTSYLDGEYPDKVSYDNTRHIKRGLFRSNDGTLINADVNAAYQIIKITGRNNIRIKRKEQILKLNVA